MKDDVVETAIARYRAELTTEAELAASDLDEIEDHLRTLAGDLRDEGMPAALAVTEAAQRLGDPVVLAREHARVRSPFGAKLSRMRAWSAAIPIAIMLAWSVIPRLQQSGDFGALLRPDILLGGILLVALVARLSWARGILLGGLAYGLLMMTPWLVTASSRLDDGAHLAIWFALTTSALVFLAPWRRGELTVSGVALGLQVWAFQASMTALAWQLTTPDGSSLASTGWIALGAAVIATCGVILRARWSAIASIVSAAALVVAVSDLGTLEIRVPNGGLIYGIVMVSLTAGIAAALLAAVIGWRTARSRFGTLGAVLS